MEQNEHIGTQQQQPKQCLLFNTGISMRKYVLRMGLISLVPSLIISAVLYGMGFLSEETSPELEGPAVFVFIMIIAVGPAIETLLMSVVLWGLSFITKRTIALAVMSSFVWAGLHSLAWPPWGLAVLWPFFVFSCSYLAWRQKGWWRAIWVTFCIHVFQNLLPGLIFIFSS